MPADFLYDVFLSHNSKDKPRVRRLAERLKAAGVRVWLDEWVIQAGDIIALKVDEGLEQSRVLLLCISPAALASGWVALERSTAVHRDPANAGRRFIPLLLGDCALPDTLRRYKYVDFREESDAAFAEIVTACQRDRIKSKGTRIKKKPPTPKLAGSREMATLEWKIAAHSAGVTNIAFSADGSLIASTSFDKSVSVWITDTRKRLFCFTDANGSVTAASFSPDGKRLIASSKDSNIYIWDLATGRLEKKLRGHKSFVNGVLILPDGKRMVSWSGGGENAVMLWDYDPDDFGVTIAKHTSGVRSLAISHDGTFGLSGFATGNLRFFKTKDWEGRGRISAHASAVNSVQITSDGRFGFTGSDDMTTRIWDLDSGDCFGTLEGHTGWVTAIALAPDDLLLASISSVDATVRLWDWRSGQCLEVLQKRKGILPVSIAFSPDGRGLVIGTNSGSLELYSLLRAPAASSAETTRRYVNAKVVLLGEGTVGKTSLAHRLIEDRYVVQDRTHGMNVWRLELPLPPDATLEREALLWDLAGQEDYRLIHQLFLEQTALALMLVNPQNPDPFVDVGAWLKALKTANDPEAKREAARLLIFSQIDVGGMKLGNAKIDRFREQHGFADWLPTSAKTGENCSDKKNKRKPSKLKQLIAGSIPWDKLPWTSTPRLLAELKNAVMAMRDESDIRLLRFSELAQRLDQALPGEKFAEPDVRTAVTLLANHGLARPLKFGDLVLLRPDLINGYAGAVIRAARAHTDEIGCVLEADIYRPDFDFTGVERLKHRPDEELLLRALVQTFLDHSLCIAEETPHGRHLVFPSQYRREKDIPHEPDIFVSYTFSGEWQTVWTTLVVRLWYSQEFAHRELWRNAAEFESARKQTLGLKITKSGDGAATISLYFDLKVPDELKVIFIEYVHRHLAKYACDVTRDRRYVCPECGKLVKDLDAVRRRLEARKDFITCQECDEKVPFVDFIEQRLKSDPVARKILAMDETATRELDTQALEQILIGHMMAIAGEANQIFRSLSMFDHGIDGEVEFKDNDGKASGKRIYIQFFQLKRGNSYLLETGVFEVGDDRHLEYWVSQPVDVYLVIRQTDELSGQQVIRWMNVTRYLKDRKDKKSRQIIFDGEKLDMEAVWKVRDGFFPPNGRTEK
ncbi:MAG: TIR domain-containing protein [Chthoniobacter sp.]|nr:TIR domain-containing protein [Chthoniobacter sp.]